MRALAWFWGAVLLVAAGGAAVLQWLGPPAAAIPVASQLASAADTTIADPDPALEEPSPDYPGGLLPRIGQDGRRPADAYAARPAPGAHPPLVALLLSGIGPSLADSEAAIDATPPAVSLAISPYAAPETLLQQARARGHELFVSIPMEPKRYPFDDAGNRALLTGNPPGVNAQRLGWDLTRMRGYVGATGALGELHGERFSESPAQFGPVLDELARRGLLYVDARPGARLEPRPGATAAGEQAVRAIDVAVDETPGAREIDAALARLTQAARDHGAAIGLLSLPRPVALDRVSMWASQLPRAGVTLVPVSAAIAALGRTAENATVTR